MKTIRTEQIGEFEVIKGFDTLPIDPEETRKKNRQPIEGLAEAQPVRQKVAELKGFTAKRRQALHKSKKATIRIGQAESEIENSKNQEVVDNLRIVIENSKKIESDEYKNHEVFQAQAISCAEDLKVLNNVYDLAKREYTMANPRYSEPRRNEILKTDLEVEELKQKFAGLIDAKLLLDGNEIEDFRGKQYFFHDGENWVESEIITGLGVTRNTVVVGEFQDSAIEKADLNQSQSEEIRIQKMTPEQKTQEKDSAIKSALSKSAQMLTEEKIKGSTEAKALTDSRAFYQSEVDIIELKYA